MNKAWHVIFTLVLASALAAILAPVQAQQSSVTPGTVVQLAGTHHLWFADEQGGRCGTIYSRQSVARAISEAAYYQSKEGEIQAARISRRLVRW